jgi:RecQ-mediated genome instability protein 1
MTRRRLRLTCSSDEEDQSLQQPENENLNPISIPDPYPSEPFEISDDDDEEEEFIDVSDNFTPPEPVSNHSPEPPPPPVHEAPDHSEPPPPATSASNSTGSRSGSGCPIGDFLGRLGLKLKTEWLEACLDALQCSVPGFASLSVDAKAKLCFERFLVSDMNHCGNGVLPHNVDSMHLVDLPGPYVLQVRFESLPNFAFEIIEA